MIRLAEDRDIVPVVKMLRDYSKVMDMRYAEMGFDPSKVANLVSDCIKQGLVWVSDEDGLKGVLVAQEQLNVFSRNIKETHLVAIYVKPEFRNGMVGGRLIKVFDNECERRGIRVSWLGTQYTTELKQESLERLGYKLQELTYVKER